MEYTIEDLKELYTKHSCVGIEVYKSTMNGSLHSDFIIDFDIESISEFESKSESLGLSIEDCHIMSEADYDESINCNSSVVTDFGEWYDDSEAKVMVVVVKQK